MALFDFKYTALTFFGLLFHGVLLSKKSNIEVLQPRPEGRFRLFPFRSSLTQGISYDFYSSGYLDISVPLVTFLSKRQNHHDFS